MWHVVRWEEGKVVKHDGSSSTARHLYKGTIWAGVMEGMTIGTELEILGKLNGVKPE